VAAATAPDARAAAASAAAANAVARQHPASPATFVLLSRRRVMVVAPALS